MGDHDLQPVRTVLGAILGGIAGAVVFGVIAGYGVFDPDADGGLAALGAAIVAAAGGALLGAVTALAFVLRHAPAGDRSITIVTVLLVGPPLCALVAVGIGRTTIAADLDARHLFAVWLTVVLPATALLGRWIARRRAG